MKNSIAKLTKFVEFVVFDNIRKCEIPRGPATWMKSFSTLFLRTLNRITTVLNTCFNIYCICDNGWI